MPPIAGDGDRLVQVVTNLISNAIKYTPSGGKVMVKTQLRRNGVELVVEDSGQGIAPADLARIFERFYQVDKARGPQRGTGLGLAIVQEIVQAHGGTIAVNSAGENRGSTFTVWIPVAGPQHRHAQKVRAMRIWLGITLLLVGILLTSCGAPVFMSDARRLQVEPELIQELQPYLEDWATEPWDSTESERKAVAERLHISIGMLDWHKSDPDRSFRVIKIGVEALGKWSRGYLYVFENVELHPPPKDWQLRKVDDHLYIYNYVE